MNTTTLSYSIKDFCQIVGISRATLYKAWSENNGPKTIKVGKRRLISRNAADAWIKSLESKQFAPPSQGA